MWGKYCSFPHMLLWIATVLSLLFFPTVLSFFFLFFPQNFLCQFYFFNIELVKNLALKFFFFKILWIDTVFSYMVFLFYFFIFQNYIC
jgi:hypothetical protein